MDWAKNARVDEFVRSYPIIVLAIRNSGKGELYLDEWYDWQAKIVTSAYLLYVMIE